MKKSCKFLVVILVITIFCSLIAISCISNVITDNHVAEAIVTPTTNLVNNGIYYIRNQRSGKYLDVSGAYNTNGTNVLQYTYNGDDNQRFKLVLISSDVYEIVPVHAQNMRIDINGASADDDANVQIYESNSTSAQRFKIVPTGNNDGAFKMLTACTNYQKCITVAGASYNNANVIQYGYGNNGTQDNDHWYFEDVTLNERIEVSLSAGMSKTYQITIPDDKFYVVETSKKNNDFDTILSVSGLTSGTMYDDNGGLNSFSQVCFNMQGGRDLAITVGFANSTTSGVFYLQIRRQQAVLYGGVYSDGLDTTSDLLQPSGYLGAYGVYQFINQSAAHFLAIDTRNYKRFNSEIVFFSGHGNSGIIQFTDGFNVGVYDLDNMSNVRLAVWSSCKSADTNNYYNTSMVNKSVAAGAKSSLGFVQEIDSWSAQVFTNKLFEKLYDGYTIEDAAISAANLLTFWDPCQDYIIAGNLNTTINTPSYTKNSSTSKYTAEECNEILNSLKKSKKYQPVDIKNGIRYYLTVNGYISNHYVDVMYDKAGQILDVIGDVEELCSGYEPSTVLPILITPDLSPNVFHVQTVYVEQYGVFIPVLIQNIRLLSLDGYLSCKTICTNLNDGNDMKYEDFAVRGII